MITITAFKWVPPFARGLVKDLRVRWALEEAGLPYRTRLVGPGENDSPAYRAMQPFGQVPVYEEGGLTLFESGAIVLRLAERSEALSPRDEAGRAKTAQWVFAALNSVEPFVQELVSIDLFHADQAWAEARRPGAEDMARLKIGHISKRLRGREYLEDRFTAGDLMMVSVLRNLRHTDLVTSDAELGPYVERCEARPAFQRALAAQMADFVELQPEPA